MAISAENEVLGVFSRISDPRIESKKTHLVVDLIVITICAVMCGADDWVAVVDYAKQKEEWLKTFLKMPYGIPSHDTFGRFFSVLEPQEFENCFVRFAEILRRYMKGAVVAFDGKTIRGSFDVATGKKAIHVVSAWCTASGISLGQLTVGSKTNEITAVPELIKKLTLEGCIVTGDAMNAQKAIVAAIVEKKGDYVIALKGNQGDLHEDVSDFMNDVICDSKSEYKTDFFEEIDKDHGRIELRRCWTCDDLSWLGSCSEWKGLKSIAMVESTRTIQDKETVEKRYYISSLPADAEVTAKAVRSHWQIENTLHWTLDVTFKEDMSRVRVGHADENLSRVRKIALALLKRHTTPKPISIKRKRAICGWNNTFLEEVLGGQGQSHNAL